MIHVLGIDAGGTKTVCQLADEHGEVLAEARRGGANLQAVGELEVEKVLHDVMEEAHRRPRRPAGRHLSRHRRRRSAGRCARGARDHEAHRLQGEACSSSTTRWSRSRRARRSSPASSSIAGTGSIAYGRNEQNQAARAGGWGYMLGDEGSGYWIGRAALRAVLREADRRGPATQLTGLLLNYYGVARAQDLIAQVYHGTLRPSAIASLAQCVQGAFSDGDAVAIGILRGAADQLESSALSVARRLELIGIGVPVRALGRHLPGGAVARGGARAPAAAGVAAQPDASCSTRSPPAAPSASRSPRRAAATPFRVYKTD